MNNFSMIRNANSSASALNLVVLNVVVVVVVGWIASARG